MYPTKEDISKNSCYTAHFSDKQIFYFEGKPFKIFSVNTPNPKAPQLALLDVQSHKRISGLFVNGSNVLSGDIIGQGKKHRFFIEFRDKNTIILRDFREALEEGGLISKTRDNNLIVGLYSPSKMTRKHSRHKDLFTEQETLFV